MDPFDKFADSISLSQSRPEPAHITTKTWKMLEKWAILLRFSYIFDPNLAMDCDVEEFVSSCMSKREAFVSEFEAMKNYATHPEDVTCLVEFSKVVKILPQKPRDFSALHTDREYQVASMASNSPLLTSSQDEIRNTISTWEISKQSKALLGQLKGNGAVHDDISNNDGLQKDMYQFFQKKISQLKSSIIEHLQTRSDAYKSQMSSSNSSKSEEKNNESQ